MHQLEQLFSSFRSEVDTQLADLASSIKNTSTKLDDVEARLNQLESREFSPPSYDIDALNTRLNIFESQYTPKRSSDSGDESNDDISTSLHLSTVSPIVQYALDTILPAS